MQQIKSDTENFLVRKQTIIKFFLFCKSEKKNLNAQKEEKVQKNNREQKIFDGRNNCAKKGSSIYALRNNNNKRDNKMLLIFRDFVARIHADSFVEGSTGVA
jgi:D-lyxose ketol-isomerase